MEKEMNSEVYRFYKNQYISGVILFHVGDCYQAYNDDAAMIDRVVGENAALYGLNFNEGVCSFKGNNESLLSFIHELKQQNIEVHLISYVDQEGNFVLPKVKQILQDMEDDY